jgi:hypothetical protein
METLKFDASNPPHRMRVVPRVGLNAQRVVNALDRSHAMFESDANWAADLASDVVEHGQLR